MKSKKVLKKSRTSQNNFVWSHLISKKHQFDGADWKATENLSCNPVSFNLSKLFKYDLNFIQNSYVVFGVTKKNIYRRQTEKNALLLKPPQITQENTV